MTAKQYLSQIGRLNKVITNKLTEIHQLKAMAYNITVVNEGEIVQTSGSSDRLGNMVARIVDMERELQSDIDKYIDVKGHIITQIESMPKESHYKVLFARYVEEKQFDDIADEMHHSLRHVMRLHASALEAFEEKYKNEIGH